MRCSRCRIDGGAFAVVSGELVCDNCSGNYAGLPETVMSPLKESTKLKHIPKIAIKLPIEPELNSYDPWTSHINIVKSR